MKYILCIGFLLLLSCGSKKPPKESFIPAKEIIENRYYADISLKPYLHQTGKHKFQVNNLEVVYEEFSGKIGLRNTATNQILSKGYTYLAFIDEHYLIAEKDSLSGVIDTNGNIIIPLNYNDINFYNVDNPFFLIQKDGKYAIFNYDGKELYPFTIRRIKSDVNYKNKFFLIAEDDGYSSKLIKISNGKVDIITSINSFELLKNNLAKVYYIKNSTAYYGVYNMENDEFLTDYGNCYYHKPRNEIWAMSKASGYKVYDVVIDSTFTVKPNKYENVTKIENDNIFIDSKNGMQLMDLNGKLSLFIYPKIESFNRDTNGYISIYGKAYSDYQNRLFKFYADRDSKKYGVIDKDGTIIVPAEKFDYVTYSDLNNMNSYNKNSPLQQQQYLWKNKLDKLFYGGNYYSDKSGQVTIFRADGSELISIPIEKGDDCYLELSQFTTHGHLMAKCNEKMKIYELDSKKLVLEINESKSYENFKERYPNGYYYFSFDNTKNRTINYLSNKLKLLYAQVVVNDSVWYKMIKGDKVPFKKDNKTGLIDFEEKEIVPPIYDKIDIVHPDFNIVMNEKKQGVITNENRIVIALVYDKIIYNISNQSFDCYLNDRKEIKYLGQIRQN